jgi:ribosome-associated translation inhibitor RaiA
MAANVRITFRDLSPPQLAEERIRERVDRLGKLHPRITACRIVVEAPHRHRQKGVLYLVRIDVTLPGSALVVDRNPNKKHAHEDFFVAMRDAFNAMEQKLRTYAERQKGRTRTHAAAGDRVAEPLPD